MINNQKINVMGYTSEHIGGTIKSWWENSFTDEKNYELLDSSIVHFNTMYSAVREKSTGDVLCFVTLLSYNRHDYHNLSHKTICETSGPVEIECPKKIFKLLTPLNDENDPNGWAREWRNRVERVYKIRKYVNSGKMFKLKEPVRFSNGEKYKYFQKRDKIIHAIDVINGNTINKVRLHSKTILNEFDPITTNF